MLICEMFGDNDQTCSLCGKEIRLEDKNAEAHPDQGLFCGECALRPFVPFPKEIDEELYAFIASWSPIKA
jgi:hypothetical protein